MSSTDLIILRAFRDYLLSCSDVDLRKGELIEYLSERIRSEELKLIDHYPLDETGGEALRGE